jgi:hypothetical protein
LIFSNSLVGTTGYRNSIVPVALDLKYADPASLKATLLMLDSSAMPVDAVTDQYCGMSCALIGALATSTDKREPIAILLDMSFAPL